MKLLAPFYLRLPLAIVISDDAIVSAAINLEAKEKQEIIDVEYEEISSSYDNPTEFNVGDRVIVSAYVTGTGENMPGWIDSIETFCDQIFISVSYERPTAIGRIGDIIRNPHLITKVPCHV